MFKLNGVFLGFTSLRSDPLASTVEHDSGDRIKLLFTLWGMYSRDSIINERCLVPLNDNQAFNQTDRRAMTPIENLKTGRREKWRVHLPISKNTGIRKLTIKGERQTDRQTECASPNISWNLQSGYCFSFLYLLVRGFEQLSLSVLNLLYIEIYVVCKRQHHV